MTDRTDATTEAIDPLDALTPLAEDDELPVEGEVDPIEEED